MESAGTVPYRFTGIDARLAVRLLGTFEVVLMGKPVSLSARAAQSLLAYLLLTQGVSHRREKLAGMFWPDVAEDKARSYLRHELWRIRKALTTKGGPGFLLSDDLAVSFILSKDIWLDVDRLRDAKDATTIEDLKRALSLYEGDLLPGFYDEWILREREHIQALYEETVSRLLELLIAKKRWHDVAEWAERWISHGQGSEAAYRALMAAYDAMGDRTRVAASYKRCVEALHELGLEPSEQTRTLALKRTAKLKLPLPITSFIGRERELEEVASLISTARLVTFTGSGGVGKTRLAIQVVADILEHFPDGVWFVDLAPVSDPAFIPAALAAILNVQGGPKDSITEAITGYLRSRKALVILDNCEHLIDACAHLAQSLLTACESLSVLATSREVLRIPGEVPYRVPSLSIPSLDVQFVTDALQKTESTLLFIQRAGAILPGFAIDQQNALLIAQICQRLGGIPLAIELAAARVNVLSVEQICNRLDDRFNLLTGGSRSSLPRHQTLRATIEWSYDLLSEKERLLFQRLAVFVGGWALEAAEAVCSGDGIETGEILNLLSQLVDKSLVLVDHSNPRETRYRRLETIRQLAYEKLLISRAINEMRNRHYVYFLDFGEQADQEMNRSSKQDWKDRLELDRDNFRAAFEWCVSDENTRAALCLLGGWSINGRLPFGEIEDKYNRILALREINAYPKLYARLLNHMAGANWLRGDTQHAKSFAEESQTIWLRLGETGEPGLAACLEILGAVAISEKSFMTAQSFLEKSMGLYQKHGDESGGARVILRLGDKAMTEGRYDEAAEQYLKALEIWKKVDAVFGVPATSNELGELARVQGDYARAGKFYQQAVEGARKLHDHTLLSISLFNYAWASLHTGAIQQAKVLFKESLELDVKDGSTVGITYCLTGFAGVLGMLGKPEEAAQLFGAAECFFKESGAGTREPADQKEVDHFLAVVHEQLDEVTFAKAWALGSEMTLEQAIAFALVETSV